MICPTCGRPWRQKPEPSPGAACPHCRDGSHPAVMDPEVGWVHELGDGNVVACVDEGEDAAAART